MNLTDRERQVMVHEIQVLASRKRDEASKIFHAYNVWHQPEKLKEYQELCADAINFSALASALRERKGFSEWA